MLILCFILNWLEKSLHVQDEDNKQHCMTFSLLGCTKIKHQPLITSWDLGTAWETTKGKHNSILVM